VFSNNCTPDELKQELDVCKGQDLRLNLMFIIAATATNVCALPAGGVLDRFGPRIISIIGSIVLAAGCILFIFTSQIGEGAYIPAFLLLALGGPFFFISSFQLSNTFPSYSGMILAFITGAFDASSSVFLLYGLIYRATSFTFGPNKFFTIYLVLPVFIVLVQLLLMPKSSHTSMKELTGRARVENASDTTPLLGTSGHGSSAQEAVPVEGDSLTVEQCVERERKEEVKQKVSGVYGVLHGKAVSAQLKSWWFVLITIFVIVQMCRINYFVATVRQQYIYLLGSRDAGKSINDFFDVALPLGGVILIPLIGFILDGFSETFIIATLVILAALNGALGFIPAFWAAYIVCLLLSMLTKNIVIFVVYRPFFYTAISDYAAKVFGYRTFGTVYGTVNSIAGLFNLLQYPLDSLTKRQFHSNPFPVNLILLICCLVVGLSLASYVFVQSRRIARDNLEEEAENAAEETMPLS